MRSGVSFRSALEEKPIAPKAAKGPRSESTPGPNKNLEQGVSPAVNYNMLPSGSNSRSDKRKRSGVHERANAASGVTTKKTAGDEDRKDDTNEPSGTEQAGTSRTDGQSKQKPGEATRQYDLQDSREGSPRWVV